MNDESEKNISAMLFQKREEDFSHASFDREIAFYESICSGNIELVRVFMKPLFSEGCGILSDDPIRNLKYHVVVLASLIARACINGGMSPEESYSLSDFYINKVDKCSKESEIRAVHAEMIEGYTKKMRIIKLNGACSKYIVKANDFILAHLHGKILIEEVAEYLKISPEYLSRIFRKETNMTFTNYTNKLKIEEACSLLLYTEHSDAEIGFTLGFSSQSYFIKVFRKFTGLTPKEYKKKYRVKLF